jgi:hypothetical protein
VDNTAQADSDDNAHPARGPRLVPARVTQAKFNEQLDRWHDNEATFARRGWLLLSAGDLNVEVGFLQMVAMGAGTIPVMTACVRLDYWNFDLWPPSLTFLDPLTRQPGPPPVRAPDRVSPTEVRDALIDQHPATLQPFLCLPGIREYHTHPQHSGDDWLLHRHMREGDLAVVCDRIWRRMARNVLGMSIAVQSLAPAGSQIPTQLEVALLQGDADLMQRQIAEQQAAAQAAQAAQDAAQLAAAEAGQAAQSVPPQPVAPRPSAAAPAAPPSPDGLEGNRPQEELAVQDREGAHASGVAEARIPARQPGSESQ